MPCCAIITCRTKTQSSSISRGSISSHRFPKEPDVRKQWINVTGRKNWTPTKTSTICSIHFNETDFIIKKSGNRYLKPGAIPRKRIVHIYKSSQLYVTMSMIEVDPKLFVTCRLCLDEMGQYQIVPQVQMQIKYCFDIEVEPFDGLPQLICKKCESILSQYAGIKQIFQEKQCGLKSKVKGNDKGVTYSQQQQDTVSSTQQIDSDSNSLIKKDKKKNTENLLSNNRTTSIDRESCKDNDNVSSIDQKLCVTKRTVRRARELWKDDYMKHFVCWFCSKSLKDRRSMTNHVKKCHLIRNYSNVLQRCFVKMNKIGSTDNLTFSNENVVCSRDKIINCRNKNYYVLYTLKSKDKYISTDSSDDDFTISKKKYKRRRLLSKSSNETLVIEDNNISKSSLHSDNEEEKYDDNNIKNQNKLTDVSDIEYVNIDDSDSASTTGNLKTMLDEVGKKEDKTPVKPSIENDKVIQNIIMMCYSKYLKRLNIGGRNPTDSGNIDTFLQHKILSIGRKVIHDKGLTSTGLLRYMEHKDLDVIWKFKNHANVIIKTTLKDDKHIFKSNDSSYITWKSLKEIDNFYEPKDFIDIFENTARLKNNSSKSDKVSNLGTQFLDTEAVSQLKNNVQNSKSLLRFDDNSKLTDEAISTNLPTQNDFIERRVENSVLFIRSTPEVEKQTILKKLLNANPVANPKQLPKKPSQPDLLSLLTPCNPANIETLPNSEMSSFDNKVNNNNEESTMPIITSTMSLANVYNNKESNVQTANKPELEVTQSQVLLPRIKVKPVSELMPEKSLNQLNSTVLPTNAWASNFYNEGPHIFVQNGNSHMVYMTNGVASCSNVNTQQHNNANYSQYNMDQSSNILASSNTPLKNAVAKKTSNQQYVTMHTVELPNKKTNSPFRYFQELLQTHNMVLLDSVDVVTSPMSCLIKFKLVFRQESSAEVTLCLSLFYNMNKFCIRVKDVESKHLDIARLSAYWQWEILKEFKGDIVSKLYENATKIGPDVLNKTTYFVNLLSSIVFSK